MDLLVQRVQKIEDKQADLHDTQVRLVMEITNTNKILQDVGQTLKDLVRCQTDFAVFQKHEEHTLKIIQSRIEEIEHHFNKEVARVEDGNKKIVGWVERVIWGILSALGVFIGSAFLYLAKSGALG